MALRAVIFDLWETLIHDPPELGRARQLARAANVRAVLEEGNIDAGLDSVDSALVQLSHSLTQLHEAGRDVDASGRVGLFLDAFAKSSSSVPEDMHPSLETAICTIAPPLYPFVAPDAAETLAGLKSRGLALGLISNAGTTTAPTLRQMLEHYGLAPFLDALVFSDEHRLAKPAPALFHTALDALGCEAAEAVFVGDSPHHDLRGAREAGIKGVLIGPNTIDGLEPDGRISALAELPHLLDQISLEAASQSQRGLV
jgi:putative hydrolase of the HAD superfamily